MKNQYFADAGDHGKYGFLRYLSSNGIRIAINWYLTADDGSKDGRHIGYLSKSIEREKDPALFDFLKKCISENNRTVKAIEESAIIENAVFYSDILDVSKCNTTIEKQQFRRNWHIKGLETCKMAALVFIDPDNGIKTDTTKGLNEAVKYAFTSEIADYFNRGQNVVYYCSKARRSEYDWDGYKHIMSKFLPDGKLFAMTFHGGTQRTYIFVLHQESYILYKDLLLTFLESKWRFGNNRFTFEAI